MRIHRTLLPLLILPLLVVGCSTITNLTPAKAPRNSSGLYPVEVSWQTRQQSLKAGTLKPQVMVGNELYPMQPVPLVSNRWETLVPIQPGMKTIQYRFKFDWEYNAIPVPRKNTKMSPEYKLELIEKR
ncbi:MAG: hypothetical protein H7X97_09335 [Opitutaceae bacterium]|nr:hypothetical protein [Verrucomicrobiales bacterium]